MMIGQLVLWFVPSFDLSIPRREEPSLTFTVIHFSLILPSQFILPFLQPLTFILYSFLSFLSFSSLFILHPIFSFTLSCSCRSRACILFIKSLHSDFRSNSWQASSSLSLSLPSSLSSFHVQTLYSLLLFSYTLVVWSLITHSVNKGKSVRHSLHHHFPSFHSSFLFLSFLFWRVRDGTWMSSLSLSSIECLPIFTMLSFSFLSFLNLQRFSLFPRFLKPRKRRVPGLKSCSIQWIRDLCTHTLTLFTLDMCVKRGRMRECFLSFFLHPFSSDGAWLCFQPRKGEREREKRRDGNGKYIPFIHIFLAL